MLGERKPARFGLGRQFRLARRRDFQRVLGQGMRRRRGGYAFYVAERHRGPPRLGILISRRHSTKATVRNHIKRCIREAFRLERGRLAAMDLLVRPPYGARPGGAMIERLRSLLVELAK